MVSYCDTWVHKSQLEPFRAYNVCALNVTTRELIGQYLNTETDCCSEITERQKDWRGLAELMGFNYNQIKAMAKGKTVKVLEEWWTENPEAIIGELLDLLEQLERTDIFADSKFLKFIARDVEEFLKNQERLEKRYRTSVDLQMTSRELYNDRPEGSRRKRKTDAMNCDEWRLEEDNCITTSDQDGRRARFDAFLCYTSENFPFVEELILRLEKDHGFKLFIPKRDLLPVGCYYAALAQVIKQRCSKMLIVVSRAYLRSEACDFMTKFAQSLSPGARNKKIIPILLESDCDCPDILSHMAVMDYDNCEIVEWFWDRLSKALLISPSSSVHDTGRYALGGETGDWYKKRFSENLVSLTQEDGDWDSLYPDSVCTGTSAKQNVDGKEDSGLIKDMDTVAEPDEFQTNLDEVKQSVDGYSGHNEEDSSLGDLAQYESEGRLSESTEKEDSRARLLDDDSGIVCP